MGTWIPEQDRIQTIALHTGDATYIDPSQMNDQFSVIIMKWTGCNPNTVIGTLYVTVSVSVEP